MTILFVSIEFNYCCGVSQSIFSLAKELKNRGHHIILAAPGGTMVEEYEQQGMNYFYIPVRPREKSVGDFWSSMNGIRKIIKKQQVDIVHSHNRLADFLSQMGNLFLDTPTVITAHALISGNKLISFRSDKVIAVSNAVKRMLLEDFGVKNDNILLARNIPRKLKTPAAADVDQFRRSVNATDSDLIIAAIGRLHPEKGFDVLLKALKGNQDKGVKTIIVGKGEEKRTLEGYAQEHNLNVTFVQETKEIELVYSVADIIVVPSRQESAGLVAIEAGFFKKPVIATNVGGLVETIKDRITGMLVEPDNAEEMSKAISTLVKDRDLAAKLGDQLNQYVNREYESSLITDSIELLYTQLITGNGNRDDS